MSDSDSFHEPGKHNCSPAHDFERLWAPYRTFYSHDKSRDKTQTFLDLLDLPDREALIVARSSHVFVLMNLYPYNPGHCMVVPYRKVADIEDLNDDELLDLMQCTQKAVRVLKKVAQPSSFNIGLNLGKSAGGSISEHLHQHIVPRWVGDSSFITVLSNVKILVHLIEDTRDVLAQAWEEI